MLNEKQILLESYKKLAEFMAESLGVLHSTAVYEIDPVKMEGKVIAACGPNIARSVGDPLTPFAKMMATILQDTDKPGITHVDTEASTANGRVKLSIFPIREQSGRLAGLFAIQADIDLFYQLRDMVNVYLGYDPAAGESRLKAPGVMNDDPQLSFSDYMQKRIREEIEAFGVPVERMTNRERLAIIRRLEKMEVFFMRDSIKTTAELLGISVPSVYRLMKQQN